MFEELSTAYCKIDEGLGRRVVSTQGVFFADISGVSAGKITADLLNPAKAVAQADILGRFAPLQGKTVLEIGSGLGVNMISWTRKYGADVTGIEPEGCGFDSSLPICRELLRINGIHPEKLVVGKGEALPFPDESFDIVYSTNVLEHVDNPFQVFREGLRVLKRGGTLQFVYPNYHSFFDGHYAVFHPPVFWKSFFPWYVKHVWHRDPAYANTLRTELSVSWTRRHLGRLAEIFPFEVLSLGEEVFVGRMRSSGFSPWAGLFKVKRMVDLMAAWRLNGQMADILVKLGCWTPVILTLRKK